MTRKPLPKAITRSIANLQGIAADFVADEQGRVPRQVASFDAVEPEPEPAAAALADKKTPADLKTPADKRNMQPAAPLYPGPHAARRRELARKVVARYKNYAALGGLVPLPVVSIASLTAINMRMVKALSDLYGVPFQRDRTRSLIVGIVGGAVPAGLGTATASTLMFIIPGGMLYGIGVSAVSAAALTRGIGLVFIESFESGATASDAEAAKPA
jgi:uncharacterized protein (DUF697 family)